MHVCVLEKYESTAQKQRANTVTVCVFCDSTVLQKLHIRKKEVLREALSCWAAMTLDWNSEGLILIPCLISDPDDFGQVISMSNDSNSIYGRSR